ncbi:MAG TPA: hypothetical protein VN046_05495 [Stenotrophobium sp.]|nr:hypothetical protein [Stenotrophobium sp.]
MGILNRIRKNLGALGLGTPPAPQHGTPEQMSFSAELPGGADGAPLWRMNLQLVSEPHGDGDKLRLRAHFQTNFASTVRAALQSTQAGRQQALPGTGSALTLAERTGALAQRALVHPLVRKVAAPLLRHDFNTWIDLQASTASLDAGAVALLPQHEKLTAMGIAPSRRKSAGPVAESWSGQSPNGFAQVSILQIDKRHLPQRLASLLADKPFQMAAAIVNTVEEK